jgi:pimeloyl-ACP methyl ester carboxylesterase
MNVGGVELETVEIPGAEPALVFLHEGLGSVALWRDFPRRLAEETGRRALVYSRTGHGQSDLPSAPRTPRFMHDEALEVLPELLRAAGIERPVLVGHSDGGSIALIHAGAHPVSGLVLLAPHVFVEEVSVASIAQAREAFETTDLGERMARYHRDPERTFRLWNDIWLAPEFRAWNIEDVLGGVTAPVLLIQGAQDQYGTLAQIDAIERGVRGPVTRVVPDAGHAPHLEATEATLAAAAAFVLGLRAVETGTGL